MDVLFTRTDYRKLPEGFPAQLVQGELVREPAPPYLHQCLVTRVLGELLELVGYRRALCAPVDVEMDELNVYQPDLVVLAEPLPGCSGT